MNVSGAKGFNLIELMITVVIIAILAGIAYPSYNRYTTQARRADAKSAIMQVSNRLEKFFSYCNSYPTSANALTDPWPATCPQRPLPNNVGLCAPGTVCNTLSTDQHYQITVTQDNSVGSCAAVTCAGNPNFAACVAACGYTIVANPNGAGVTGRQRTDGRFRLDSRGVKEWDRNNDGDYADAGEISWGK